MSFCFILNLPNLKSLNLGFTNILDVITIEELNNFCDKLKSIEH
jgi:hypothetical protein